MQNKKTNKNSNQSTAKRAVSLFLIFAIFAQIVIGGIFLPAIEVEAFADPAQAKETFWNVYIKTPLDKAYQYVSKALQNSTAASSATTAGATTTTAATAVADTSKDWVQTAMNIAWNVARKKLLDMLVNNIIKWIQGGGNPKFITDWNKFLRDTVNEAGGKFILSSPDLAYLCSGFGTEVRIALGAVPPFQQQVTCTLDQVATNINNFYDDMRNGGGWDGWLKVSQGSNNVYGAYLAVQGEKMSREALAGQSAVNKAIAGSGFLGEEICEEWTGCDDDAIKGCREDGNTFDECQEAFCDECKKWGKSTPGKTFADLTSKAIGTDIDYLISAKEWQQYVGAIADAAFNKLADAGLSKMAVLTGNSKKDDAKYAGYLNDLYSKLDQGDSLANQFTNKAMRDAARKNDSIEIATRNGQRQLLLDYRKVLRDLKSNIKKSSEYLESENENGKAAINCTSFKSDMCKEHANDPMGAYDNRVEFYLNRDETKEECLPEPFGCSTVIIGNSVADLCADNTIKCKANCAIDDQICLANCQHSNCLADAKRLVSDTLLSKCSPIQDQKDSAEEFAVSLDAAEKDRQYQKIYSGLLTEQSAATSLLQKLERYKPFDQCISDKCASASDPEACKNQTLSAKPMEGFIQSECDEAAKAKQSECMETRCSLEDNEEACMKDTAVINSCKIAAQSEKDSCISNLKTDSNGDGKIDISVNFNDKNTSGICYTQQTQLVLGTLEEFNTQVASIIKSECGNDPAKECSDASYTKITYDPYNKCIRDNMTLCGSIPSAQCYNSLTSPEGLLIGDKKVSCYDKQFETMTYDDLIDNPATAAIENEDTAITDADKKTMQEIQDTRQQDYSQVLADTEINLKRTQRSGEECFDGSKIPDKSLNEYEVIDLCIKNVMNTCAPTAISKYTRQLIVGVKQDYTFPNNSEWESFWRGCIGCIPTQYNKCLEAAECQTWWQNKDVVFPYKIPTETAKKIDIWNFTGRVDWSPFTPWPTLFNIDSEISDIKAEIEDSL